MLVWVGVTALAIWGALRIFSYPRPGESTLVLSRREHATLAAVADAMFPPGGAIPPSGTEARLPRYVDRFVAASHPRMRLLMRLLFFLVEQGTIFFPAPGGPSGFRRFSGLAPEQRVRALEGWRDSRLFPRRLVFTSVRAMLTFAYFAHPPVLRQLGVAPYAIDTPICEADLLYPRIGALPGSIPYTQADLTPPSDGTPIPLDAPLRADFAEGAA